MANVNIFVPVGPCDLIERLGSKFVVFLKSILNSSQAKTPDHGSLPLNRSSNIELGFINIENLAGRQSSGGT